MAHQNSSVHGISQARILGRVAISPSRGSSRPSDGTCVSGISRWILYHWDIGEAHNPSGISAKKKKKKIEQHNNHDNDGNNNYLN